MAIEQSIYKFFLGGNTKYSHRLIIAMGACLIIYDEVPKKCKSKLMDQYMDCQITFEFVKTFT